MADGWDVLQGAIDGRVVLPGSPDYDSARKPEMVRFQDVRPVAVVLCGSPAEVSRTIAHPRRHRLEVAIRSGGHSVAGRSSTEGLVLDVTSMDVVSVQDDTMTVGAGVRLGHLYDVLHGHGRTLPAGGSHSVGIAGLTLGGGIGILGRKYGLSCDHLLGAQVVMADGQVLECDQHENDDLFWALRGAGSGNFGVVTSLVFSTVPAPAATVFHLVWRLDHANQVIEAWQEWRRPRLTGWTRAAAERHGRWRVATGGRLVRCGGGRRCGPRTAARRDRGAGGCGADLSLSPTRALPGGDAVPRRPRSGGRVRRGAFSASAAGCAPSLHQVGVLQAIASPRHDRGVGGEPCPRSGPGPVARGGVPALGRRVQPRGR